MPLTYVAFASIGNGNYAIVLCSNTIKKCKALIFYLHFNGNSQEAFSFYKSVFGGEFIAAQRYKDVPGGEK